MITKNNFHPLRVWSYIYREVSAAAALSLAVAALEWQKPGLLPAVPFATVGLLGSALAIFVAFRNNAAYSRWWEARNQWAALLTASRSFARQTDACTRGQTMAGKVNEETAAAFRRELILRQAAFAHALRGQLRGVDVRDRLVSLLPPDELAQLRGASSPAVFLLQRQTMRVKEGMESGWLGAFDGMTLEPPLAACETVHANCAKLQDTPMPRQYAFFTRVLVWLFIVLLPLGLLGMLPAGGGQIWLVPLSVLVAATFSTLDRTGQALETPFANSVNDVPMTYLCELVERDLRESLGEKPSQPLPDGTSGYLW